MQYIVFLIFLLSASALYCAESAEHENIDEHEKEARVTPTQLDIINITAQRQTQTNSSHSLSLIENIQAMQSTHIHEALNQSPGTWISRGNGQEHLSAIRSAVLVGAGGCGPFLMSEDNISLRAPAF